MDVAERALDSLRPKLAELLSDEYNLHKGARKYIRFLARELEFVSVRVSQAGRVPIEHLGELARLWARDVTELSYDIEDMIDTFLVRVDDGHVDTNLHRVKRLGEKAISLCGVKKNARTRPHIADGTGRQIVDKIKAEFKVRIMELSERYHMFRNGELPSSRNRRTTGTVDPRLPALYRNERELVGINEARDEIVRMLQLQGDDGLNVKIVSILGMGGIGKTTLAKAVYNSFEGQFECSAFVSVSRNPDLTKVFGDILLQLDEAKYCESIIAEPRMDERQLIDQIRSFLENKRYFIVFDDLWYKRDCDMLKRAMMLGNNGQSWIIITTRICDFAKISGHATYRLKPLSHADSEKLFYKRIFGGQGNRPDNQLSELSDKILEKCDGLPLAIITVASVLASKPQDEWSEAYNSIYMMRHESNWYVDNMRAVLSLSYYDLPARLKTCLLHLSAFHEDCWIEKDLLIWMWIAEGFVSQYHDSERSLFELGERCFYKLGNRSLIQIEGDHFTGDMVGCRVHPALFSLIHFFARQQRFSTVLDDEHLTPGSNIIRRLALNKRNGVHSIQAANTSMEKVRSFNASLCFMDWMPQLPRFRVLRVLALEYCPGMDGNHLKEIGNLVHLRYLGLVGAGVLLEFPEEAVRGLKFLQTLDLRETGIEQLPRAIFNLKQLMCLRANRIARTVPEAIGKLASLEYLQLHHVSGDSVQLATELSKLGRLRVLEIGFEEFDERLERALVESLRHHESIQCLQVYCQASARAVMWEEGSWVPCKNLSQLVVGGIWFSRLPAWIDPSVLIYLSHLHLGLGVEVLEDRNLETIGRLPALRSLMLMVACDQQPHIVITIGGGNNGASFKYLKFFTTNVPIKFECGLGTPMPSLEDLELRVGVRAAKDADSWFGSIAILPSLQKVMVALECHGASAAEVEEADAAVRRAIGILRQDRPTLEVITKHEPDEVPLIDQFRPKNPRFEALRCEMEKMQAARHVQIQPDQDSQEISPAETARQ